MKHAHLMHAARIAKAQMRVVSNPSTGCAHGAIVAHRDLPFSGRIEQPTYGIDLAGTSSDSMRSCAVDSIRGRFNGHKADNKWRWANTLATLKGAK